MKISTKGRYGTRALLDVALHQNESPVQLKAIAQRQQISLHYLEHIIAPLIAAGMLRSTRGARGGVSLGRSPQEIKLSEVVQVLEGSIAPVECVDDPNVCSRADLCVTRDIWAEMKGAMASVLESTTLQDLVERQREKQKSDVIEYYI
jgi:Rrf2 family protein